MYRRMIARAYAEARITKWHNYVARAEAQKDVRRVDYGLLRLGNAQRRLRKMLRS